MVLVRPLTSADVAFAGAFAALIVTRHAVGRRGVLVVADRISDGGREVRMALAAVRTVPASTRAGATASVVAAALRKARSASLDEDEVLDSDEGEAIIYTMDPLDISNAAIVRFFRLLPDSNLKRLEVKSYAVDAFGRVFTDNELDIDFRSPAAVRHLLSAQATSTKPWFHDHLKVQTGLSAMDAAGKTFAAWVDDVAAGVGSFVMGLMRPSA